MKANALRTEYLSKPTTDVRSPRFGWQVEDNRPAARQIAYEIVVTTRGANGSERDAWKSDRVDSPRTAWIAYEGVELEPMTEYRWRVRLWDDRGVPGPWSEWSFFEIGRRGTAWEAEWVAAESNDPETAPLPLLRRSVSFHTRPTRARLYVTALGLYEFRINGKRIGKDELRPGWTDYQKRVVYDTYDVTGALQEGENVLGAMLGHGWYSGRIAWFGRGLYGDAPALRAELRVGLEGGDTVVVATDPRWQWHPGPVIAADLLDGEHYDATKEIAGWDRPGFDAAAWRPVVQVAASPSVEIVARETPPVRAVATLSARSIESPEPGVFRFDLGQNLAGRARIRIRGNRGAMVTIRHAEILEKDGSLYIENLRSARATDRYVLRGDGEETYEPRFTFHGFRYVELATPTDAAIEVLGVEGVALHNDLRVTGSFTCSDALLDRLFSNQLWGQRGNYLEVPTDCPQRDERLGWTGDAQVFAPTACYNMDVSGFFSKWLRDLRDAQGGDGRYPKYAPDPRHQSVDGGPAWAEAGVVCAWRAWLHFGDQRLLEEHYDSMCRFLDFLDTTSRDGVRPIDREGVRMGYGDWLALDGGDEKRGATPRTLIGTAYHAHVADLMSKIASILRRPDDARRFRTRFAEIRLAFRRAFLRDDGRLEGHTQTAYLLALAFNLLDSNDRAHAFEHLVRRLHDHDDHLATGFVGTPLICPVLTKFGRTDLAYRVLMQRTFPGWLYSVSQGATTIWERWNGYSEDEGFGPPDMNSFNHYAYGAVGQWLYETVLGIAPMESHPGFERFHARPIPGGDLRFARGHLDTLHGRIEAEWRIANQEFMYDLRIPPNTAASVEMPFPTPVSSDMGPLSEAGGKPGLPLAAGRHRLVQVVPNT